MKSTESSQTKDGLPGDLLDELVRNVFEIADVSDEEAYFTIGVFLSLEEAVAAIEAQAEPWTLCDSAMFAGENASMEIRRKKLNVLDPLNNGEVVWSRKWVNLYHEDSDDNVWAVYFPNVPSDLSLLAFGIPPAREAELAGGMPKVPKVRTAK